MSRTLPTECGHGYILDWADFADDGDRPEHCPDGCNLAAFYDVSEAARQLLHMADTLKAEQDRNEELAGELAEARAALSTIRDWAYANHGGRMTPAEVWPGLAAALLPFGGDGS